MADVVDAIPARPRPGGVSNTNSVGHVVEVGAKLATITLGSDITDGDVRYKMNNPVRGKFIIINNKSFMPHTRMNERTGTDVDAAYLQEDFKRLGFKVEMYHNRTTDQMLQLMINESRRDHSPCDCFGVAVLTHGAEQGIIFGTDGTITIDCFVQPIKDCTALAGKPKIFIFQACRGNVMDHGVEVHDALGESPRAQVAQRIPLEADFIYAYSTCPGYYAWRNKENGSWFIQALHLMLDDKYSTKLDFVSILTRVNYNVAYAFESNSSDAWMARKKQIPSIVSMLTKDLYFTRK